MDSSANSRLLLDIGGSFVKGAVAVAGELLHGTAFSRPIRSDGPRAEIEATLRGVVAQGAAFAAARGLRLGGIGVAIPGPFDYAAGVSLMRHKFGSIRGVGLREVLLGAEGMQQDAAVHFMQDVNAALAGEIARGNAAGYKTAALVTLGTGLGFALSRGGAVLANSKGGPHTVIFDRPYRDGILEDYASKRGFLRIYAELSHRNDPTLTVADLGGMADGGDPLARRTFATIGEILAGSLRGLIEAHGIECLLFGGQIARSFAWMEPALRAGLAGSGSLRQIAPMRHIGEAAFYGLLAAERMP